MRRLVVVILLLVSSSVTGCAKGEAPDRLLVGDADAPAALAPLAAGGLRYGERLTGRIREVDADGRVRTEPLAQVQVSTEGQRGVVGLAVDGRDRTFAAWTDPELRLVVGQVSPPPVRMVWQGPTTARIANGGHLAFSPAGVLVISIGDLQRGDRSGRLLGLDADGPSDQSPSVISSGWNNPYAFSFSPEGSLWIADNAPGDDPERLARVDADGQIAFSRDLPGRQIAPSGLVALSDRHLVICAYLPAQLILYDVESGRRRQLAGCRTDVTRLAAGDLAYAGDSEIGVADDPLR